jgi:hypothetical protein
MERETPAQNSQRAPARRRAFQAAALVLAAGATVAVIACLRSDDGPPSNGASDPGVRDTLRTWKKPDLVLLLSAQQHGYLQPCGCSKPQFGGLTRRYNLVQFLKDQGWPVVAADLGDVAPKKGLQLKLTYTTSMKALRLMNYAGVGLGEYEMAMPLIEALAQYALNNPTPPVLAANLKDKKKGETFDGMVKSWVVAPGGPFKVGIIGSVGPSVAAKVTDPDVHFERGDRALPLALKQVQAQRPNFLLLLYQGSVAEAKVLAKFLPQFNVILCLSAEEEPPSVPEQVGRTQIITLGHKGRYVGVLAAYRTGKADPPFQLRYKLAALGEEFDSPKGAAAKHPVMNLMEDYARQVKRGNYLAKAAVFKSPHDVQSKYKDAFYVGSAACAKCHKEAFEIWSKSPHSKAYQTLVDAKHPSLRQYDSECIKCHVTGWEHKTGFMNEVKTPKLLNNGCENCHGPGSEHIRLELGENQAAKERMRDLINPYRYNPDETPAARTRRINLIDQACQHCHDIENDVNWKIDKWWDGKIVHSADKKKRR